jgi:hypothetical protein
MLAVGADIRVPARLRAGLRLPVGHNGTGDSQRLSTIRWTSLSGDESGSTIQAHSSSLVVAGDMSDCDTAVLVVLVQLPWEAL